MQPRSWESSHHGRNSARPTKESNTERLVYNLRRFQHLSTALLHLNRHGYRRTLTYNPWTVVEVGLWLHELP
jgi:hypothetical protein